MCEHYAKLAEMKLCETAEIMTTRRPSCYETHVANFMPCRLIKLAISRRLFTNITRIYISPQERNWRRAATWKCKSRSPQPENHIINEPMPKEIYIERGQQIDDAAEISWLNEKSISQNKEIARHIIKRLDSHAHLSKVSYFCGTIDARWEALTEFLLYDGPFCVMIKRSSEAISSAPACCVTMLRKEVHVDSVKYVRRILDGNGGILQFHEYAHWRRTVTAANCGANWWVFYRNETFVEWKWLSALRNLQVWPI